MNERSIEWMKDRMKEMKKEKKCKKERNIEWKMKKW